MFFIYKFHKTYYNETDQVPIGHQSVFPIWNPNLTPVWACVSSAICPERDSRSGHFLDRSGPDRGQTEISART